MLLDDEEQQEFLCPDCYNEFVIQTMEVVSFCPICGYEMEDTDEE